MFEISDRSVKNDIGIIKLQEHYRSHPDIIRFSNDQFYGRFLKVYTNPSKLAIDPGDRAVEWIDIKGQVTNPSSGSAFNKIEARAVFDLVIELMERYFDESDGFISIGIVTPLRAQVEYLKNLFLDESEKLPAGQKDIYQAYTNGPVPFYIDTAYKFQGNERDIIIFSTVASDNMKKGTYSFINERRQLNVAITRARAKLFIVGNKDYGLDKGGLLGALAKYTDELLIKTTLNEDYEKRIQSPIELKLYRKLLVSGLQPIPQYADEGFNIDFAVLQNGKKVAIECLGVSFHSSNDGKMRKDDIIRKRKLTNAGWIVKVFWSWEIEKSTDKCVKEIMNEID